MSRSDPRYIHYSLTTFYTRPQRRRHRRRTRNKTTHGYSVVVHFDAVLCYTVCVCVCVLAYTLYYTVYHRSKVQLQRDLLQFATTDSSG